jgi:hypothetical protein
MKRFFLTLFILLFAINCFGANEILSQRNYVQKVFDLGNGQKNYKIHTAQIHYKDTLNSFQDIDTRLTFDNNIKQWKHNKASYNPTIPEYADGIFDFRNLYEEADFTLQFKPVAQHIKGQYFETEEGRYVLYPNAFGQDIDLKVYSYWAGIKKVIYINKPPTDLTKDLTFDFEIVASSLIGQKIINKDDSEFDFSKTSAQLDFTDKTIRLGTNGKYTYFRNASMWDSLGLNEKVTIKLVREGTKLYIRKTIPASFLQKATFPVYTDHPTSYYAGAGDGNVEYSKYTAQTWDTIHNAATGILASPTEGTYVTPQCVQYAPTYKDKIGRAFFPVDTSGIDDSATIDTAILYLYFTWIDNNDNDASAKYDVVNTSQADSTTLATSDYSKCGSVHNPVSGSSIATSSLIKNQYDGWTLNADGKGWVNKTGYTLLGLREGHDFDDHPITSGQYGNDLQMSFSETTGTSQDPYLDVTTSGGGAARRIIMVQ